MPPISSIIPFIFYYIHTSEPAKCYSCSSTHLDLRWPKDKSSNKLLYLNDFPFFANESCDQVRNLIPVVDCPDSLCIKVVIKEPPAKREACVQGGALVRDCWSRVMTNKEGGDYSLKPQTKNNMIRLSETIDSEIAAGFIYTCDGFLCNHTPSIIPWCTTVLIATTFIIRH